MLAPHARPTRTDGMSTRRAENLHVAGETERLERLVQNVRNLQTGCTVHTGNVTIFSLCQHLRGTSH
jgi:hypothetical protein